MRDQETLQDAMRSLEERGMMLRSSLVFWGLNVCGCLYVISLFDAVKKHRLHVLNGWKNTPGLRVYCWNTYHRTRRSVTYILIFTKNASPIDFYIPYHRM